MKREIKFRGKSKDNGKWLYGHLFNYGLTAPTNVPCISVCVPASWEEAYSLYAVHPDTIGQYIGLKDKNGKEIYEGDIVTIGLCTALVTWNEELATFALKFDFENKVGRTSLGEWDDMIVIGNIHDNPELLKGGSNEA